MAKSSKVVTRRYKSECFIVAIGDTFFLGAGRWAENPSYAQKYSDAQRANADALDVERLHPNQRVRVVSAKTTWTLKEAVK